MLLKSTGQAHHMESLSGFLLSPYHEAMESPGVQSLDCFAFLFILHLSMVLSSFITLHLDAGDSQIYISSLDLAPGLQTHKHNCLLIIPSWDDL